MSRRRIQQSQVLMYLKCGKAWEFRHVKGIIAPPSAALTVGSSTHAAVKHNLTQKITSGIDVPKEAVLDAYSTDFDARAKDTEWGKEKPGEQKDLGARLVELHHAKLAPTIQPAKVEETFLLETDQGYDLGGTIDLIEKDGTVGDTKTSAKRYSEFAATRAIQPALYDFAYEALNKKKAKGFRYDVLLKHKVPEIQQIHAQITSEDRSWMIRTVNEVRKAMDAGIAMPATEAPGVWWCSPKFCGYWHMCKGKTILKPVPQKPAAEETRNDPFRVRRNTGK